MRNDRPIETRLKTELVMRGYTYKSLAEALGREFQLQETESSLRNKVYRGTISASLLLHILWVIGAHNVRVDEWIGRAPYWR